MKITQGEAVISDQEMGEQHQRSRRLHQRGHGKGCGDHPPFARHIPHMMAMMQDTCMMYPDPWNHHHGHWFNLMPHGGPGHFDRPVHHGHHGHLGHHGHHGHHGLFGPPGHFHGGPFAGPMGPFGGRHGPWGRGQRGHRWCRLMNEDNEEPGSSGTDDTEKVIEINEDDTAGAEAKTESAAMETEGDLADSDKEKEEKNDDGMNCKEKKWKGPGPGPRIMAAYWAGRLGMPLPFSPRGKHEGKMEQGKCGRKLKGHGHGGKCKKLKDMIKKMKEEGCLPEENACPPPPPFGGPGYGPPGFGGPGMGPCSRMGMMHGHPGFGGLGMGPSGMGHPGFDPQGGPGPYGKWMRKHMIREAFRQYMQKNKAECEEGKLADGKDDCPEKRQDTPNEGPCDTENGSDRLETRSKNVNPAQNSGKNPWGRWAAWQQHLQQIYSGEESDQQDFEADGNNPTPMWRFGRERRFGRGPAHCRGRKDPDNVISCNIGLEEAEKSQGVPTDVPPASTAADGQTPTAAEENN